MPLPNEALSEEHLRLLLERARKIEEEATKENHGPNQKRSITPFVLKLSRFVYPPPDVRHRVRTTPADCFTAFSTMVATANSSGGQRRATRSSCSTRRTSRRS
jgi:hypothetical protein